MLLRQGQSCRRAVLSQAVRLNSRKAVPDHTYEPVRLETACSCGEVKILAHGPSYLNYYCHSATTREQTGDAYTTVSAFKPHQVNTKAGAKSPVVCCSTQPDSKKAYLTCACKQKETLLIDNSYHAGLMEVNLKYVDKQTNVAADYLPNHHFHYAQRLADVADNIPKWKQLIDGDLVTSDSVNATSKAVNVVSRGVEWDALTGRVRKDVLSLSSLPPLEPAEYHYTDVDPPVNHTTKVSAEKIAERVSKKYIPSQAAAYVSPRKNKRDVIIVGGGHNGLVTAAYLSKAGMDTLVLERRHIVGGAAVTEEMVPGFKFSRASYLAGLFRPHIINELELERHGFKYLPRNPSSFTPTKLDSIYGGKYLLLGSDEEANWNSIAQFSKRDADSFVEYEAFLSKTREIMQPILDNPPMDMSNGNWRNKVRTLGGITDLVKVGYSNREVLVPFYELFTGPAQQLLDRWFESDILKTTLATDAVIGALISPKQNGSAYVLLHHVMGEAAGKKGVWAYVEGGMGAISKSIAASAMEKGAEIVTNATVKKILTKNQKVIGVQMEDGSELYADTVVSGTTPYHTFMELLPGMTSTSTTNTTSSAGSSELDKFNHLIRHSEYSCGAFKINCALSKLPNFACFPSPANGKPGPMHMGTVHFEYHMEDIENAYREAALGIPATRPLIEMTIPTSVDSTLAPPNQHVAQLFVQYAPYEVNPKVGSWADPAFKAAFVQRCLKIVDEFCPGFSESVIGIDALSPLDLERVFGLHKGSISHGSFSLHQLGFSRPVNGYSNYRSPIQGLYMCSAGTHPGGGVMGAAGNNCSKVILADLNKAIF